MMINLSDGASLMLDDVTVEVAEDNQVGIKNTSTDDLAVGGTVTFLVEGKNAIGIDNQSETAFVDSNCNFIVTGEGAAGIIPEQ